MAEYRCSHLTLRFLRDAAPRDGRREVVFQISPDLEASALGLPNFTPAAEITSRLPRDGRVGVVERFEIILGPGLPANTVVVDE